MVKWLEPMIPANGATRPNVNTPPPSLATGLMSQGNMVLAWTHYFCRRLIYCTIVPPRSSADPPSSQQELDADVRQQKLERGKPPTAWTRRKHCKVEHTSSVEKFKILQIAFTLNSYRALLSCFGWLYAQASHLGFTPMTELTFPLATQVKVEEVEDAVTLCCCSC